METVSQLIQKSASRLVTLNHQDKLNKLRRFLQNDKETKTLRLHFIKQITYLLGQTDELSPNIQLHVFAVKRNLRLAYRPFIDLGNAEEC